MRSLRTALHGIVGAALAATTGSCFGSAGELFTSHRVPSDAARGVPVEARQCAELCRNTRATACSIATREEGSLLLQCSGRQPKGEVRDLGIGADCNYLMGHPKARGCRYVAEDTSHLEAEWTFAFSGVGQYEGGVLVAHGDSCTAWCGRPMDRCEMIPDRKGIRTQCQTFGQPAGRRPAALRPARLVGDGVERALREAARLEAASVTAFRQLARELAAHGAPARLVQRARSAARDEARHAREVRRIAAERGIEIRLEATPLLPIRPLAEVALENAVEGCVRETYGALVVLCQSRAAPPELRAAYARIADDEVAHAELAWAVARWSARRLGSAERADVLEAARGAAVALEAELAGGAPGAVQAALGLPDAATSRSLLERLRAELFEPAFAA